MSDDIAVLVATGELPDRIPASEVRPGDGGGHDGGIGGLFHHRVVDGNARGLRKGFCIETGEVEVALGVFDGFLDGGQDIRCKRLQLLQHSAGGEDEHPGIPGEVTAVEHLPGDVGIGLFDKAGHFVHAISHLGADLDIAVTGGGLRRLDAEGDDLAAAGGFGRACNAGAVGVVDGNLVVGGQDLDQRVAAMALADDDGGGGNGGINITGTVQLSGKGSAVGRGPVRPPESGNPRW